MTIAVAVAVDDECEVGKIDLRQGTRNLDLVQHPVEQAREAAGAASRTSDAEARHARRHAAPAAKDAADQTRRRADKGTRAGLGPPRLAPRADRRPAPAAVAASDGGAGLRKRTPRCWKV